MIKGNTFKVKADDRKNRGIFALIGSYFNVDGIFGEGVPVSMVPKALFVALLMLVYIFNSHQGDRMARQIASLQSEVEDLRTDFTTLQSEWMTETRRSRLIEKAKALGLVESTEPPFKILEQPE
jgi:cell division protein FtsL